MADEPKRFRNWAEKPDRIKIGRPCETCRYYESLLPDIEAYLEARVAGTVRKSLRQFHGDYLRRNGYEHSYGALKNHCENCLSDLWMRILG